MDNMIANIRMVNIHKLHLLNGGGEACTNKCIK